MANDFKPCLARAMFAVALLALTCGIARADTKPPSALPTPTLFALPTKAIPKGGIAPIYTSNEQLPDHTEGSLNVSKTPCFQTVLPFTGLTSKFACEVSFAAQPDGANTKAEPPYFYARALSIAKPDLEAYVSDQRAKYRGYSSKGCLIGVRSATIFQQPARVLSWVIYSHGRPLEYVEIVTKLPSGRYVNEGKPLTMLVIDGFVTGFEPKLFKFALAHFELL
jgi:hypothetical protein